MAFSEFPRKRLIRRCCLIHLKKTSIFRLVRTETGVTRHGSRALPAQPCCPQRPRDEECARFVNSQTGAGNSDSHDPSKKRRPPQKRSCPVSTHRANGRE